jgi:YidC/Oxa1 family membrane protein insertase
VSFLSLIFKAAIYQPLYNGLIILYDIIPDLGVGIIILTLIIRLLLIPVAKKSIESQKKMQEIQPKIKELQQKYKNDKQKQGIAIMELYKKHNINPASGCLPMVIQIVFLVALYRVFIAGINSSGDNSLLYSFISNPGKLNSTAFGFLDLTKGSFPLAAIAAALQYFQTKMLMAKKSQTLNDSSNEGRPEDSDFSSIMQNQMLYMGPILTLIIGIRFPAGLPIYWITTTLFMIIQQYYIIKKEKSLDLNQKRG